MSYRQWKKYRQLSDDDKEWLFYLAFKDFVSTPKAFLTSPEMLTKKKIKL